MQKNVSVVLINEHGNVLCVSRKDNHLDFGMPAGKVDDTDLNELEAAHREVKEETGLDINNLRLIYANCENESMGYTYLADYSGVIEFNEPHVVKWGSFKDLIAGTFSKWNENVYNSLIEMKINVNIK
jgi:8-oxo-dGTP pyrophosphatase MutT (NUDIX family)